MPEWRACVRFPNYEVSDDGRMRSAVLSKRAKPGRLLSVHSYSNGYLFSPVMRNGKQHTHMLHRAVAEAFLGPPPTPKHVVCHNDGSRNNNRVTNLRWGTASENQNDRDKHGTGQRGDLNHRRKFSTEDVLRIREASLFGARVADLSNAYGMSQANICRILKREMWAHV